MTNAITHITYDEFVAWIKEQPPDRVFNMMNNAGQLAKPAPDHCGCLMMEYAREKYTPEQYEGVFCSYSEIRLYKRYEDTFGSTRPDLSVKFRDFTLFSIIGSSMPPRITAEHVLQSIEDQSL